MSAAEWYEGRLLTPRQRANRARRERQRAREAAIRAKSPPSPKRIRCWQRRRQWAIEQPERQAILERGTYVATLIEQQAGRAARSEAPLYPADLPELRTCGFTRSGIARDLAGWVAYAWKLHGRSELVGSHAEMADLVGCHPKTIEHWMRRLIGWGWIVPTHHFEEAGALTWQVSNSYRPGLRMIGAFGAAAERAARGTRARLPPSRTEDPKKLGSVVSLPPKEAEKTPSARDPSARESRISRLVRQVQEKVSPETATRIRRPTGASVSEAGEEHTKGDTASAAPVGLSREWSTSASDGATAAEPATAAVVAVDDPTPTRPPWPGRTVVTQQKIAALREEAGGDLGAVDHKRWFALLRDVIDAKDRGGGEGAGS